MKICLFWAPKIVKTQILLTKTFLFCSKQTTTPTEKYVRVKSATGLGLRRPMDFTFLQKCCNTPKRQNRPQTKSPPQTLEHEILSKLLVLPTCLAHKGYKSYFSMVKAPTFRTWKIVWRSNSLKKSVFRADFSCFFNFGCKKDFHEKYFLPYAVEPSKVPNAVEASKS